MTKKTDTLKKEFDATFGELEFHVRKVIWSFIQHHLLLASRYCKKCGKKIEKS